MQRINTSKTVVTPEVHFQMSSHLSVSQFPQFFLKKAEMVVQYLKLLIIEDK